MPRPGELVVERTPAAWVLGLPGEHDASTAEALSAAISASLSEATNVVVDLTESTFLDSVIIGVLFAGYRHSQANGGADLVVVAPAGSRARRIIELVHLPGVVPVYETVSEAVAALGGNLR
jgi:anti-anti-sigma factor